MAEFKLQIKSEAVPIETILFSDGTSPASTIHTSIKRTFGGVYESPITIDDEEIMSKTLTISITSTESLENLDPDNADDEEIMRTMGIEGQPGKIVVRQISILLDLVTGLEELNSIMLVNTLNENTLPVVFAIRHAADKYVTICKFKKQNDYLVIPIADTLLDRYFLLFPSNVSEYKFDCLVKYTKIIPQE